MSMTTDHLLSLPEAEQNKILGSPNEEADGLTEEQDIEISYDEPGLRLEHAAEKLASDIAKAAGIDPDYEQAMADLT